MTPDNLMCMLLKRLALLTKEFINGIIKLCEISYNLFSDGDIDNIIQLKEYYQ